MTDNNQIPITRRPVSADKAAAIRRAVQEARSMPDGRAGARLAVPDDAKAFHAFLSDPAVHAPIYTLPNPLTPASVRAFIERHTVEQAAGEGLLFLNVGGGKDAGDIVGYCDICVWPDWAAGEMGGALHPDRQGAGRGTRGAGLGFGWMFDSLGLELICETAALDNVRTAHLLDHLGFARKGTVTSQRDDGTTRPSLVWEITREEWKKKQARD